MSPHVATVVFVTGIALLFALYRDPKEKVSKALWLPTIWILLAASRMVSVWLNGTPQVVSASQYAEGSPLDRLILTGLLLAGILVLLCRWRRLANVLSVNTPLLMFFAYCALSTLWSDYTGLAFKRWIKAIGDVVMVLIILSDRNRLEAIKRIIVRMGFVLMPLSVLFIVYYPNLGRMYSLENASLTYTGVTTSKNLLGLICMIVGVGCVWLIISTLHDDRRRFRRVLALGATLAAAVWLLFLADSVTSWACLLMGTALLVLVNASRRKRPANVNLLVGAMLTVAAVMFVYPEIFATVIHALGRNTTLTGRTGLWKTLLSMDNHPWLGTGFESFWLGPRLNKIWSTILWQPNEAHNGYLEVFLNLGWVGVSLLAVLIATGYRNVISALRFEPRTGSLRLAYFVIALAYSFSEAGFRLLDPMWIFFLLAIIAVPFAAPRKDQYIPLGDSGVPIPVDLTADAENVYARIP